MNEPRRSSPYSSGGGGFDFERGVAACYLTALLRSSAARGLDRGTVKELRFQRAFEGEPLDDLIIISDTVMGEAKLSLQLKRDLSFGASDPIFERVIGDAWATLQSDDFVPCRDRFGIVIGTYSKTVDKYYRDVPNWARKSAAAADFLHRISTEGLSNKLHRDFLSLIRDKLHSVAKRRVSDTEIWEFMCGLVILHFDVHEKDSRDRSHAVDSLQELLRESDADAASDLFRQLLDIAASLGRTAGSITFEELRNEIERERPLNLDSQATIAPNDVDNHVPEKLSISRMPVTGRNLFGREQELNELNDAWRSPSTNIVSMVAWGGVGKTALVNHWIRTLGPQFGGAERIYAWSFYSQGTDNRAPSGDVFIDTALSWFGDSNPASGSGWERGERLARLVRKRRTLLLLDGLEPLQYPPGQQEGRLRDQSIQALLRELAASNNGLCVISTRLGVADLAEFEGSTVKSIELEHLSSEAGAQVLQSLGVVGQTKELETASEEFGGHCLALTLLGSYLSDIFEGDIHKRLEVGPLEKDIRHGGHARRVMESYTKWFGDGPEVSVLLVLGLFDRPATSGAVAAVCSAPPIPGLTDRLSAVKPRQWRQVIAKLQRARLISTSDPQCPEALDAHPLIREHFGQYLEENNLRGWRMGNERLFHYFSQHAEDLPNSIEEMEPLFQAMVCGNRAGKHTDVFREIYLRRIMRGDDYFTGYILGSLTPLLAVLSQFFEEGDWASPIEPDFPDSQGLSRKDLLTVLTHAGWFLTATKSYAAPDVGKVFSFAETLCETERELFPVIRGLWVYMLVRAELVKAGHLAEKCLRIATKLDETGMLMEGNMSMGLTEVYKGRFGEGRSYLKKCLALYDEQMHRKNSFLYGTDPGVAALAFDGFALWLLGYPDQAISQCHKANHLAVKVGHPFSMSLALYMYAMIYQACGDVVRTMDSAGKLIEFCARQGSLHFMTHGKIFRGWATFASGNRSEGIRQMSSALQEHLDTGAIVTHTYHIAILADSLGAVGEQERGLTLLGDGLDMIQKNGDRRWEADLYRVRGDLLNTQSVPDIGAAMDAYQRSIAIAQAQSAKSLELRTTIRISQLLSRQGRRSDARDRLSRAYDWFTEGFGTRDLREAAEGIRELVLR